MAMTGSSRSAVGVGRAAYVQWALDETRAAAVHLMTVSAIGSPPQPWGEALRTWRAEIKGWSQEELVEHLRAAAWQTNESRGQELDEKTVRRWESGQSRPQGVYRRLLVSTAPQL